MFNLNDGITVKVWFRREKKTANYKNEKVSKMKNRKMNQRKNGDWNFQFVEMEISMQVGFFFRIIGIPHQNDFFSGFVLQAIQYTEVVHENRWTWFTLWSTKNIWSRENNRHSEATNAYLIIPKYFGFPVPLMCKIPRPKPEVWPKQEKQICIPASITRIKSETSSSLWGSDVCFMDSINYIL